MSPFWTCTHASTHSEDKHSNLSSLHDLEESAPPNSYESWDICTHMWKLQHSWPWKQSLPSLHASRFTEHRLTPWRPLLSSSCKRKAYCVGQYNRIWRGTHDLDPGQNGTVELNAYIARLISWGRLFPKPCPSVFCAYEFNNSIYSIWCERLVKTLWKRVPDVQTKDCHPPRTLPLGNMIAIKLPKYMEVAGEKMHVDALQKRD